MTGGGRCRAGPGPPRSRRPTAGTSTSTGASAFSPRGVSTRTRTRWAAPSALSRRTGTVPRVPMRRLARGEASGRAPGSRRGSAAGRRAGSWSPRSARAPRPRCSPGAGRGRGRPDAARARSGRARFASPRAGTPVGSGDHVHLVAELAPDVERRRRHVAAVDHVHAHVEGLVRGLHRAPDLEPHLGRGRQGAAETSSRTAAMPQARCPRYFVLTGTNVTPVDWKAPGSFLPCLGLVA